MALLSRRVDEFIEALAPNGTPVRMQMGTSGRIVYGQMASGEERQELNEERLATLIDAVRQPMSPVIEQDYSKKRPAIAILVDGNTVFRQEGDKVVSVNDVLQAQIESVQLESEPESASINQPKIGLTAPLTPQVVAQPKVASEEKTQPGNLGFLTERSRSLLGLGKEVSLTPAQALAHLEHDAAFWEVSQLPESEPLVSERRHLASQLREAAVVPDDGYRQNLEQQNQQVSEQKSQAFGVLAVVARLTEALPVSNTKQLVTDWVNQTTAGVKEVSDKAVEKGQELQSSLTEVRSKSEELLGTVSSRLESVKSTLREQQVASVASKLFKYYQNELLKSPSSEAEKDYKNARGVGYTIRSVGRNAYEIYKTGQEDKLLMRFKETAWGYKILSKDKNFDRSNYPNFVKTQEKLKRLGIGELSPDAGYKHWGQFAPDLSGSKKQLSMALE